MLGMPTPFIVCTVMWIIHGFVLDFLVIGVLPFLSKAISDGQRNEKFPWALGGYAGYGVAEKVNNLGPTHRRFMTGQCGERLDEGDKRPPPLTPPAFPPENLAYALLRFAPVFFIKDLNVLCMCTLSYAIEGSTIAWEISTWGCTDGRAMLPQTLMGVFSSIVTYAATTNPEGFLPNPDPTVLMVSQ